MGNSSSKPVSGSASSSKSKKGNNKSSKTSPIGNSSGKKSSGLLPKKLANLNTVKDNVSTAIDGVTSSTDTRTSGTSTTTNVVQDVRSSSTSVRSGGLLSKKASITSIGKSKINAVDQQEPPQQPPQQPQQIEQEQAQKKTQQPFQHHKRSKSTGSIPTSGDLEEFSRQNKQSSSSANTKEGGNGNHSFNGPKDQDEDEDEEEEEGDEDDDEEEEEETEKRNQRISRPGSASSQKSLQQRTSSSSSKKSGSGSIFNKKGPSALQPPPSLSKSSSFSKSSMSSRKSSFDKNLPPSMVTIGPSSSILKKNSSRHSMSSSAYYSDNALTDEDNDNSSPQLSKRRSIDSSKRQLSSSSRRSSSGSVLSNTSLGTSGSSKHLNTPLNSSKRNSSFGDIDPAYQMEQASRTSTKNSTSSSNNGNANSIYNGQPMGSRKSSFSSLRSTGKSAYSTPVGSPAIEMQTPNAGSQSSDYFSLDAQKYQEINGDNDKSYNTSEQLNGSYDGQEMAGKAGTPVYVGDTTANSNIVVNSKFQDLRVGDDVSHLDEQEKQDLLSQMQGLSILDNVIVQQPIPGRDSGGVSNGSVIGMVPQDQRNTSIPTEPSSGLIVEKKPVKRPIKPIDIDVTIQKLLDAGYSGKRTKNLVLKNSEIQQICSISRDIFLEQPSLLELSPPVKIAGDVHGQFQDLVRMFDKCGFPPSANYLFLGDYVDRGKQSLETILLLLCYKIKYPENFFLLRGNHECASVTRVYGFYDECKRRCNIRTWKLFVDTFNTLPLAAIVAGKIFCVHGGLSPVLNSMDEVRHVSRPTDVPDFGLINDLLWSDPTDSINEWEDNERGVSYCYNKVAINKFLNRFGFDLVCRAHMVVEDGYEFFNAHTLVTVFSAPNYCGEFDNWGAVMSVSDALLCSFELLEPLDSSALKQVMKKGRQERKQAAIVAAELEQLENQQSESQPAEYSSEI